uniref:activating transcription factor 7-interacting protein 2 n=1 Tax=Euleptes europaea TaxID=460621 RepID=UPI00254219A7|nr:activating transcription factor 7-interacting protein 2 [Euleptes europaea]
MDPDVPVKKPLRARKTMTLSSRKQMEILKNLHRLGKAGSDTYSVDNYVQLKMIGKNCLNYTTCKETNTDLELKQTSAKEPVAKLVVNSEISIYNDNPDVSRDIPYNGCKANTDVKQFLNTRCFEDLLYTLYKKDSGSPVSKPVEVRLYSKPTSKPLDHPEELTSSVASFTSDTPSLGKTEKTEEMPENPATAELEQEHGSCLLQEGNTLPDDALRKRRPSECKEVGSKRRKSADETSDTGELSGTRSDKSQSGLDRVRCLIHRHVDNVMGDLDRKVQQLNERIDHTQCLRKHEEITIRIIKKISRLDRRVNSIADLQNTQLPKKANLPVVQEKVTILNMVKPLPGSPNDPSIPSKGQPVEAGETPSKTARSSAKEMCLAVETPGVQAGNSADVPQKGASSNAHASTEAPRAPQNTFLIDLTDEDDTNPEKEISVEANPPLENTTSLPPQPMAKPSKKIPAPFPHLPPLPKIRLYPQHVNGFKDTLPPQKLELAIAQVQNPKGIALQWNVSQPDARCAPIESFHLFICIEGADKGAPSAWIKTNEIKALPLPMACSLSQFTTSGKCYFAMQSKDVYGRFGPFCDIQLISAT